MKSLSVLAAASAIAFGAPALAASYRLGGLEVLQPWSRPAAAGTNGVGYMTLANRGKAADALVAVQSPAAERVEIHSSSMAGGVMRMAKVDRVPVAAGAQAALAPGGGHHLMFIHLNRPLKSGDRLPAVLVFASGARLKVDFAVGTGFGPPAGGEAMPPGMKMDH